MAAVSALARNDLRNIRRDTLLAPILVAVPAMILALRLATPPLAAWLQRVYGFDAEPYFAWVLSALFLLNIPVLLFGGVFGLLLLDERDDRTLTALRVTPLGLDGYLAYRLLLAGGLAAAFLLLGVPATGLLPGAGLAAAAWMAAPTSILAAAGVLLLVAVADNKVEGLALVKGASFVLGAPLLDWFSDAPWTLALRIIPTWWPIKGFWEAAAGRSAWGYAVVGTVYGMALGLWLLYRVRARLAAG